MLVKFPYSASRRVTARKPRRSKNGTPEERAAKAAAKLGPPAPVSAIHFDPTAWLKRCAVAGMEITYTSRGSLFFGVDEADHDKMVLLLIELNSAPDAKDAVKALLRADMRSAVVS